MKKIFLLILLVLLAVFLIWSYKVFTFGVGPQSKEIDPAFVPAPVNIN